MNLKCRKHKKITLEKLDVEHLIQDQNKLKASNKLRKTDIYNEKNKNEKCPCNNGFINKTHMEFLLYFCYVKF